MSVTKVNGQNTEYQPKVSSSCRKFLAILPVSTMDTGIHQNIFFCVQQKKETHSGLE